MSNEYKDSMLQLLTQVDDVKATEAALQSERKRHREQIAKSQGDLSRTENEIERCRENAMALRRQMDDLKNEIFRREEDEEAITLDPSHTPTEEGASTEFEGHKLWKARAQHLKQIQ